MVDQPVGVPRDYGEHATLMMDLLALAYQTDMTRVSTFMAGKEVSNRAYPRDRDCRLSPPAVASSGRAHEA